MAFPDKKYGEMGSYATTYFARYNEAAASVDLDPAAEGMPLVTERVDNAGIKTAMSNSFGFGGTNATLVFQKQ